jgi:hypothetical protein
LEKAVSRSFQIGEDARQAVSRFSHLSLENLHTHACREVAGKTTGRRNPGSN